MTVIILLSLIVLFAAVVLYFATLRAPTEIYLWYAGVDAFLWCLWVYLTFLHR